jgi:predicted nucleic acid-binding protein
MAKAPINVTISGDYNDKDIKRAMKDLQSLMKDGGNTESAFSKLGKSAIGLGAAIGVGFAGFQTLTNFLSDSIAEAQEAIKVNAATAQIIKSTGSAANVTADQVAELSQRLSEQIAVDDELIQQSANLILTFKNIANQGEGLNAIFDRTVLAAQDLAAAGFGDAESAAKMLGKALNDPERGLTALGRAGVTFTAQQKEQIKTLVEGGNVLEAQKVILAEVESQVGGVAGATATGIDQFNVYFANLKEELGLAILPFINAMISGVLPAIKNTGIAIQNASKFMQENGKVVIVVTSAVIALTAAMLANRIGGIAFAAQYAAHTVVMGLYTAATRVATIATATLTAAMRAIPFIAVVAGATALVLALTDLEDESNNATKSSLEHAKALREQNKQLGHVNNNGRTWLATSEYITRAQNGTRGAISGTVAAAITYGKTLGGVTDLTQDLADTTNRATQSVYALLEAAVNAARVQRDLANTSGTVTSAIREGIETGPAVGDWLSKLQQSYLRAEEATKRTGGATRSLKDDFKATFGEASKKAIAETLDTLKQKLDEAKSKFDEFASGISSGLFGQLNIGGAVDQAQESGGSIVGAFVDQAAGIQAFGDQLQALLQTNLSEEAFAMVASLSAEKGTLLANELLGANSETLIANFNQAVEATKTVADLVGQNAALKWYQTGVDSAQKTYEGFRDNFKKDGPGYKALQNLMDNLAASMKRETTVTVTTINKTINEVVTKYGGPRAMGGPVAANTAYLVGERGPELFIPDAAGTIVPNGGSAGGASGAGGGITLYVNAGMGTNGAEVGRQIVDALKAYERRNGAVYASA